MREKLLALGFTKNESLVYETLCRFTSLTGYDLAKKAGLDRSVTYNLLSNLIKKGVVGSVATSGKKEFFISDPKNLLSEIHLKENVARELIEEIEATKKDNPNQSTVEMFEGIVSSRKFYSLIESYKDVVYYSYGGSGKMIKKTEMYIEHYKDILKRNRITLRFILPKGYKFLHLLDGVPGLEVRETNMKPVDVSVNLVGDTVVYHIYEDSPRLIMIRDKAVVDLMRIYFDSMWELLNKKKS